MPTSADRAQLQQIPIDKIDKNEENPRIVFRPGELEELLESIRVYGVQVPIAVYREGGRYVLIDGERRWRCALKLNRKTIPALVQEKPGPLQNLLLMFNIHALREQWDLLTIALKLPRIITLLEQELGYSPTEREISEKTSLKQATIRRSKLLMNLPDRYKKQILTELEKPKSKQRFTEDLFIELERSLTTVERWMPEVIPNRDAVRRVLLKKFKEKTIDNITLFRDVAKIARADRVGGDRNAAAAALQTLFQNNQYTIQEAFESSVGGAYAERDIGSRVNGLLALLDEFDTADLEDDIRQQLERLVERIVALLRAAS